jgi:hypothetical protein
LETKSAAFVSGLGEAAKAARGSFSDIKGGAREMGGEVGGSMTEARHSVMIMAELFGSHMPRALASFIAGLGPMGAALEAAFPFMAVALGASLLLEKLVKMQEEGEKLTEDQVKFGTAVNTAFNSLDQKLIQAQIKADELKNDHLGALRLQLELIDKQSMAELIQSFDLVAKAADGVMKDLQGKWYTFGKGSDGANHALQAFKSEYDNLLSAGNKEEASGLLKGTLAQAVKVRDALKTYRENSGGLFTGPKDGADVGEALKAYQTLHAAKLSGTEDELKAQEQLVDTLTKQSEIEERVAKLGKQEGSNASHQTGNEEASRRAAAAKQAAESQLRMGEQSIAADKSIAEAQLTIHRASLEERLASDLDFAARERDVKQAGNQAEIAALDKSGKDYANQLAALHEKTLEINNEYDGKVAALRARSSVDVYNRDLQNLEESIREQIEATQQGTAARLAAIDAGLRAAEGRQLQDTQFYRELSGQRVQAARQEAEEEGKLRADAAKEEADNFEKMGAFSVAALRQSFALQDSVRHVSAQRQAAEDTQAANLEYTIKMVALAKELAGLDKAGKDYENKLKQLQDKEKQLTQQHVNEITNIKDKAAEDQNKRVAASYQQFVAMTSQSLTQSIMGHQTWARTLQSLGDAVVSGMIQNAIKSMMAADMDKERDAASAARKFFLAGAKLPFPANIVAAPVMAAGAFATVMAFQEGGVVPGIGRGDIVPTMLEPGEGIVPGGVMDGLRNMARSGGFDSGRSHVTVQVRPVYHVNTIDGDGMRDTLEKHTDQLQKHFEGIVRRMNR